jgi:alanine racemase
MPLRAEARVDVAAIERNCARLGAALVPPAQLGAVVKADGYGHGALPAARAALAGGAAWIFVATAAEARALREAHITARIVVMGAMSREELPLAAAADADVVAWREAWVDALPAGLRVHVKYDTGMGRLGTRDPEEATRVAERVAARGDLELAGAMTHFATADDDPDFMALQLEAFRPWADALKARHPQIVRHAANSAATLRDAGTHLDLVRCGIAIYGLDPFGLDPGEQDLEPALALSSYVAAVKDVAPGQSCGYGRSWIADKPTQAATVPIGYGDGVRRALSNRADVEIGGRRYPIRGTISMDNLTVDVGLSGRVAEGDEVLLIGGDVAAEEMAERLGTINYEITCGISARVPRRHHRRGTPVAAPAGS